MSRRRRVRFTETARAQLQAMRGWWKENTGRPEIVLEDVEQAVRLIAAFPWAGAPYELGPVKGVRRLHLKRLGSHLYYSVQEGEAVVIRALWHTSRGGPPPLGE